MHLITVIKLGNIKTLIIQTREMGTKKYTVRLHKNQKKNIWYHEKIHECFYLYQITKITERDIYFGEKLNE